MDSQPRKGSRLRTLIFYVIALTTATALFFLILAAGSNLATPAGVPVPTGAATAPAAKDALGHLLLALVVIIIAARTAGQLFRFLHQPPVIGEVLAGIMLGPSLLGAVLPEASAFLLPLSIAPHLGMIAQVGVILFMFLVGLELDTTILREKAHSAVAISHASILVPFLLGSAFALWLYPRYAADTVPFTNFTLFLGISLSVTAFPVLARILTDQGLNRSRLGAIALTCAAVDDATAWCLLAFVVGVVQAESGAALRTILLTFAFVLVVVFLIRPLVQRWAKRVELSDPVSQGTVAIACVAFLLSALITEGIGIHALFGAFILGAVIPHESRLARALKTKLEDIVVVLFLPVYFAFTGLRTQIGLLADWQDWLVTGVIILVASLGKFGGSAITARLTGIGWRDAASLGILMNTRGLMELVVLNLGLDLGVITPRLFAMLVIMALVTTLATTPVLHLLNRSGAGRRNIADSQADTAEVSSPP